MILINIQYINKSYEKGIYIIIVFATFWCGVLVSNISKVKNNRCKTNYVYIGENQVISSISGVISKT